MNSSAAHQRERYDEEWNGLKAEATSFAGVRRYDPGSLRSLALRPIRYWLGGLVSRIQGGPTLKAITPGDIEYEEGVAGDTNLSGICKK